MEHFDRKQHWEKIYQTKALEEVSWYQPKPETSLDFIAKYNLPKDAAIIDLGGGDSFLVDHLLDAGYTDISVVDISAAALERAKSRLAERASLVQWIVADVAEFTPARQYDFWHDRAAFHFLTDAAEVKHYVAALHAGLKDNGIALIGTFATDGPLKCSGIAIQQYDADSMLLALGPQLKPVDVLHIAHQTPFNTSQNFIFCSFKKA